MTLRRALLAVGIAAIALVGTGAAVYLPGMVQRSRMGAGYVAKQLCSCAFVAGRALEECRADLAESAERVRAELLPAERAVRAWVPLLAERIARYTGETGCTLE
jgi:hypothetical protein